MKLPAGKTSALLVRCAQCGHVWPAAYLPMPLATAAGMLKRIGCPCCGELKKLYPAAQDQIPDELRPLVAQAGGGGD